MAYEAFWKTFEYHEDDNVFSGLPVYFTEKEQKNLSTLLTPGKASPNNF